jgi:hypothetical protein
VTVMMHKSVVGNSKTRYLLSVDDTLYVECVLRHGVFELKQLTDSEIHDHVKFLGVLDSAETERADDDWYPQEKSNE